MGNKNFKLSLLFGIMCSSVGTMWAQGSAEAVNTNNDMLTLILQIILAVIGGGAALYFCWRVAVNIKNKKEIKTTSGSDSPVVDLETQGENSGINNQGGIIGGSNNTIQNGLSVDEYLKLTQPAQQPSTTPTDFDMDRKLVEKFFSRFSVNIFKNFISMRDPAYLDTRILTMRDGWYDLYDPTEPPFIDIETKNVFDEFYNAFSALALKCAYAYDPSKTRNLSHIRGMVGDVFDDPKDEAKFDEIVEGIKALTPIYEKLIKFVIKKYKIDLDELSSKFEAVNQ